MHLLSKQEINTAKITERRQEIDEGVKLAKKVDALREVSAKEEANLSKFRSESLKQLKNDIEVLTRQKNVLQEELTRLEEDRKSLQKPLDNKWAEFWEKSEKLNSKEKEIEARIVQLDQKESLQIKSDYELSLKSDRLENYKSQIEKNLLDSIKVVEQAQLKLDKAQEKLEKIDILVEKESAELLKREGQVAVEERNSRILRESLNQRELKLNHREKFINDKYATLERTINRLKK